jgi:hypothetical protein
MAPYLQRFEFRFYKADKDGRPGIVLAGRHPDHYKPMTVINKFLGEDVLEITGGGLFVALFMPEEHSQLWSDKLATREEFWDTEYGKDEEGNLACILIDKVEEATS